MHLTQNSTKQNQNGCFAVKVRAGGEATIAGLLQQKGYEVLLPTYRSKRQYSDRIKEAKGALFAGYLFVTFDPQETLGLVSTRGVSYIVKSGASLEPLPREEELAVQSLCGLTEGVEPCESFQIGRQVRIQSGPLKDRIGMLTSIDGRDRLVISLNSIFSSVSIDLKDTLVTQC